MKKEEFERIVGSQRGPTMCQTSMNLLRQSFKTVPELTLRSILSQELCRKMKISHHRYKARGAEFHERYLRHRGDSKQLLLQMAAEVGISPALLARIVLELHLVLKKEEADIESVSISKQITRMLRDTSLIDDGLLARDVHLCVLEDDQYGPLADAVNHSLGQQYELLLARQLTEMKIPFLNEDQMRNLGMDKTPDIKLEVHFNQIIYNVLSVPVAVNGFIIHWIESKALFGSEEWHDKYIKKQLSTYWNRYGPGMVIYWFDFVETLQPMHEKHLLVANSLPDKLILMDPSKRQ